MKTLLLIALVSSATPPAATAPAPAQAVPQGDAPAPNPAAAPTAAALPPPVAKATNEQFEEALKEYFADNPKKAAARLHAFLVGSAQTDENYAWAQYFLGRSLIQLGLRHAGGSYLARIARERSNPNVVPRALLALRELTDVPHDETMIDEQIFGSMDLGFLPEETANFAHYQQGLLDLKVGNERWANMHFAKLSDDSVELSRAKFALLVTRLKEHKEGKEVPKQMIEDFLVLSKDTKLSQETRNEALLAVARLKYEQKDYEGALASYAEVKLPELSPGRANLYLEEAWTRYQLGQVHAAMGILTTLDAPSFRDEFQPDKYLLRALIYKDLCHYLPAKRAAKELTRRFASSLEAIREREDLTQDPKLLRAAVSHGGTARAQKFLRSLDLEAERLGRYAGSFGEELFTHLGRLYDLAHAEAVRVYEERLHESVRAEADRLLKAAEQVRLMEYEVGLKLYERVKKGSQMAPEYVEPALTESQVSFEFVDEYWNDELRDYRFSMASRCVLEGTP